MTSTTTTSPSDSFGQRLRSLRKKAGLTQEELADLVGVHETTIRAWEADRMQPRTEYAKKLAETLSVPVSELLEASPPHHWVLQIKVAHDFKEEVIDLIGDIPCEFSIATTPKGSLVTLSGCWEQWADNEQFKSVLEQLKLARKSVIQTGIVMGKIQPPEQKPTQKKEKKEK